MKYIATAVTGHVLMSRDIEVEIDEDKLETALKEETHDDEEDWWEDKPADEQWVDVESFSDNFLAEDVVNQKADAITKEWRALPDCVKVRDCETEDVNDWRDEPHFQACQKWLRSKGWAPLSDEEGIWFRKK